MNIQSFPSNPKIDDKILIDFVMLFNSELIADSQVLLNKIDICYCDFITLFYSTSSGGFNLNSNSNQLSFLQLKNLMYNSNNDDKHWNIKDELLKAFSKKNNVAESSISPLLQIKIQRELFLLDSIANYNKSQVSLSLDELLHSIYNWKNITYTGNYEDNVEVLLKLNYSYHSTDLNTTVSFILPFNVEIPKCKQIKPQNEKSISFEYSKNKNDIIKNKHNEKYLYEEEQLTNKFGLVEEFYEDDETIKTIGTKHIINTLFEEQDDVLMEEETIFKAQENW
jgi:hypothetical protein